MIARLSSRRRASKGGACPERKHVSLTEPAAPFSPHPRAPQATKVAVLGAAGGIGQPLSLLLKDVDGISHLALYDIVNAPGVAADLGHINTKAKVRSGASPAARRCRAGAPSPAHPPRSPPRPPPPRR